VISALIAFVLGDWFLQQQATLQSLSWALVLVPLIVLCYRRPVIYLLVPCAAVAGFFWAAAMAQHRLQDSLPMAWEGENIQIVGVVASLPQQQERSQRFVFDVEQTLTPQAHVPARISLNYYSDGLRSGTL
jgi:competence protein ComEC